MLQNVKHMKVIVYLASSANGMISNQRNVPDWLSEEYGQGFMSLSQQAKAVIMGKTTYNILAPDYLPLKGDDGSLIVLTHDTTLKRPQPNVIFTSKGAKDIIALLESRGHTEAVIIGGTQTVSEFLKAGLVNELILVVEPVLFDGGLPLLKDVNKDYKLSLSGVKQLNDNSVQLHYRLQ
jgi:dihydrofolate reductase